MNENVISGVTSTGFEFTVDKRAITDRRTARALGKMLTPGIAEYEAINAAVEYQELILGAEQAKRLEDHVCALNDGYCPNDKFNAELIEITNACKDLKN